MSTDYSSTTNLTNTANLTTSSEGLTSSSTTATNPKAKLGKDDFMKLLLTELEHQDPTNPMDSGKILDQTSELATLESADNTNKAMESLVAQLKSSSDFNAVSAIGKMGSLGTDTITLLKDSTPSFDLYYKHDIKSGTVNITDKKGNIVKTFTLKPQSAGVLTFKWDGTDNSGNRVAPGDYKISSDYSDGSTGSYSTSYGSYPINSVKFVDGKAQLKLGNNYYPLSSVKEIYD